MKTWAKYVHKEFAFEDGPVFVRILQSFVTMYYCIPGAVTLRCYVKCLCTLHSIVQPYD